MPYALGVKAMHQQPPQTPLCLSASRAKSGQVVLFQRFHTKAVMVYRTPYVSSGGGFQLKSVTSTERIALSPNVRVLGSPKASGW